MSPTAKSKPSYTPKTRKNACMKVMGWQLNRTWEHSIRVNHLALFRKAPIQVVNTGVINEKGNSFQL